MALRWALGLAAFFALYVYSYDGTLLTITAWGKVAAATATLLFALAFGMGSLSYYTGWPDMKKGYQKYMGVLGFWIALMYSLLLAISDTDRYVVHLYENLFTVDVGLGLIAMAIFSLMVVINLKSLNSFVSLGVIKTVFGLGFIAYALLVIRAIWIEWDLWAAWAVAMEGLPPPRILLSIIATTVLAARVSIPLHRSREKKLT